MISTRVRVLRAENGIAWVQSSAGSGCSACATRQVCGVGSLSKVFGRGLIPLPSDARPGDEISISLDDHDLLRAGLYAYLLPTTLALVGAALLTPQSDAAALAGALAGLAAGLLIARWLPRPPVLRIESPSCATSSSTSLSQPEPNHDH